MNLGLLQLMDWQSEGSDHSARSYPLDKIKPYGTQFAKLCCSYTMCITKKLELPILVLDLVKRKGGNPNDSKCQIQGKYKLCSGSVTFSDGSGSTYPYIGLWIRIQLFSSVASNMPTTKYFSLSFCLLITGTSYRYIQYTKIHQSSKKLVFKKVLNFFCLLTEGS
jgi:hypothetical protein